jgi:hypothetical protein
LEKENSMKSFIKTVVNTGALWCLLLLIFACSSDENEGMEPQQEEEEYVITDPFYADLDNNSTLEDYWELFQRDAIRSGKTDPGTDRDVYVFFGTEPDFASGVTADHAGRAYTICDETDIRFEIIESFWEDFTIVQRLYTFYHEAGHARYKYRHPCENGEACNIDTSNLPIMWRSIPPGDTTIEEFIVDKDNFFRRRWDGIRYFNCED